MAIAFISILTSFHPVKPCSSPLTTSYRSRTISVRARRRHPTPLLCATQEPPLPEKPVNAPTTVEVAKRRWPWQGGRSGANVDKAVEIRAARAIWRIGWLSWWIQLVLTSVSVVILLFSFAFPGITVNSAASAPGLILSALAALFALLSLIWTYLYTRISLRLCDVEDANPVLRRFSASLRVGSVLGFVGIGLAVLATQATVGTLLARLFTAGAAPVTTGGALVVSPGTVQAVDILIVQATANAMTSLFASVLGTVWLQGRNQAWQLLVGKKSERSTS